MKQPKLAILLAYLRKRANSGNLVIVPGSCIRVVWHNVIGGERQAATPHNYLEGYHG